MAPQTSPSKRKTEQVSLTSFFNQPSQKKTKSDGAENETNREPESETRAENAAKNAAANTTTGNKKDAPSSALDDPLTPIVPKAGVTPAPNDRWSVYKGAVIYRTVFKEPPRNKVAAFDLDGTILTWRVAGWPSRPEHYELFNATVIDKLRECYDSGCKLLLITNQGAIRSAVNGKKATHVKSLVDWLAKEIDRPLHAVMSCDKKHGYHKPSANLWEVASEVCNKSQAFDTSESFFVGDSIGGDDDPQGGVDVQFAKNVSEASDKTLQFYTPEEYFGPSSKELRQKQVSVDPPPKVALETRAALTCGYAVGPILLVLCGVQGSGKSTFAERLVEGREDWAHFSQDTINDGKPGKREKVEAETKKALSQGKSVVVDRMHLDALQREHFVLLAKEANVAVHCIVLTPPKSVIAQRVRKREDHPGSVQGDKGASMAVSNLDKLVMPAYKEGFTLISASSTVEGVHKLVKLYRSISSAVEETIPSSFVIAENVSMPSIALGTMNLGRTVTQDVVSSAVELGFEAFDTAPTYKNEDKVGSAIKKEQFCIVKVPKRATTPEQVRSELTESLKNLKRDSADLLLLHWPSDVIASSTIKEVWQEIEKCQQEKLTRAIGVCNFNASALALLLSHCTILPSVNQVERHPLLPQWDLVDFCAQHDICLQAHSPLGQGSSEILEHEVVKEVAQATGQSAAQVILEWNLQQNVAVVPKCSSKEHMEEVLSIRSKKGLSIEHLKTLNEIGNSARLVAPFFMYGDALYCWGKIAPKNEKA